jgi:hypothetical protein
VARLDHESSDFGKRHLAFLRVESDDKAVFDDVVVLLAYLEIRRRVAQLKHL